MDYINVPFCDIKNDMNFRNIVFEEEKEKIKYFDENNRIIKENIKELDVYNLGKEIRHSSIYASQNGTNVNFIEQNGSNSIFVRTFKRGVEDETYSCGTGVTASALVAHEQLNLQSPVEIETLGGDLSVKFNGNKATGYKDIFLTGPAMRVFQGEMRL